ncbi:MAG: iron-sulfur cluster insertion protein ErpA [Alphaproteobacteria bacterium]|nr:MAG: iron-sulfur cluster insertion protein ErpA [Alphaproteobacteria bacterium]
MSELEVILTERAAARIARLAQIEGNPQLMLRVAVAGGGCSGFRYDLTFDDQVQQGDVVISQNGARVVIDEVSLGYLEGAKIDYVSDLMEESFRIENPKAKTSCGCGASFST